MQFSGPTKPSGQNYCGSTPTWLEAGDGCRPEGVALSQSSNLRFPERPLYLRCTRLLSSASGVSPAPFTAMAAAAAAAGPGAPLSPDELLPKGDAEKTEEELEEEDDDEVLGSRGAQRGGERRSGRERPAQRCGIRVLRNPGEGASRSLQRSERRRLLREAGLGPHRARDALAPGALGMSRPRGWLPLLRPKQARPPTQLDETLSERLWGLTEMFPERIRSAAGATFDLSLFVAQKMYR